ncbi:MAG TPA: protein kinase [Candidatus Eisenbacteria bacterium]|jgi:predicted Ser/Thr protein kinase
MSTALERIGPYPIARELGRGGMGVVYLGRDLKLDRPVAIKVLPEAFAHDPERLARFEREARILASLNHPNIGAIYGLEEDDGRRFLALEYVEGETLFHRIARHALPLDEALEVCRQIAAGLEAAHESGVVHRDLKPGNVKFTPTGQVKVLDFGLAKGGAAAPGSSDVDPSHSPTLTVAGTGSGVILGTAAYMSPEQARGKSVDRRTDIWAFGCVLFECLTGQQAFAGETVSDTIAKILQGTPEWGALPGQTPGGVRHLLERCLEKDARRRLRDIGDARIELEEALAARTSSVQAATTAARDARPRRLASIRMLVLGAVAGLVVAWVTRGMIGPGALGRHASGVFTGVGHFSISTPADQQTMSTALSADGTTLIAGTRAKEGHADDPVRLRWYIRRLDGNEWKPVPGTENLNRVVFPFDSHVQYLVAPAGPGATQNRIWRVTIDGSSPPVAVADWKDDWGSAARLESGDILVTQELGSSLVRLSAKGGEPSAPVKLDVGAYDGGWGMWRPLPKDRGVLLMGSHYGPRGWSSAIGVLDIAASRAKLLIDDAGFPCFVPPRTLVFSRGDVLLAAPFDLRRLQVTGAAVPIMRGLSSTEAASPGRFVVGENGTLSYNSGGLMGLQRRLAIVEGSGVVRPWSEDRLAMKQIPTVARDGKKIAVVATNAQGIDEIWVSELDRPQLRRVIYLSEADCWYPVWSPDAGSIAFQRGGLSGDDGVYIQDLSSSVAPHRVYKPARRDEFANPTSWSANGSWLLATQQIGAKSDVLLIPLRSPMAPNDSVPAPRPLVASPANRAGAVFSPDGRLVAYHSDESGSFEVYVSEFRSDGLTGPPVKVSVAGGNSPRWTPDGRKILYGSTRTRRLMSAEIHTSPMLSVGARTERLDTEKLRILSPRPLPDGTLVGILRGDDEQAEITNMEVVINWTQELEQKLRAAK